MKSGGIALQFGAGRVAYAGARRQVADIRQGEAEAALDLSRPQSLGRQPAIKQFVDLSHINLQGFARGGGRRAAGERNGSPAVIIDQASVLAGFSFFAGAGFFAAFVSL
jgi:hypothetical protein